MRMRVTLALAMVIGVGMACGGGGGDGGGTGPGALNVSKSSGDGQGGTVATQLGADFCVLVREGNTEKQGQAVNWTTSAAGGLMTPAASNSNASGIACSRMTLGQTAGPQSAQAAVSGAQGSPVTFNVTANPDQPTTLTKSGGDGQSALVGVPFTEPLTVRATDQFNNGVNNVPVAWSLTQGSATLNPASGNTLTAGSGVASLTVTPTAAGSITIVAAAGQLTGSPQMFNLTGTTPPPPPVGITVTVGNFFFRSDRNNSQNAAVDTVAVNGTATWNWVNTGITSHGIESTGSPSFTNSATMAGNGSSYSFQFTVPGTYTYQCSVHLGTMTGRIVVQ